MSAAQDIEMDHEMDHQYIDSADIAARYLKNELPTDERAVFAAHLAHCEECGDRVLLARLMMKEAETERVAPSPAAATAKILPPAQQAPTTEVVEPVPAPLLEMTPEAVAAPEPPNQPSTATVPLPGSPEPEDNTLRIQLVTQFRPWQIALLVATAGMVLIAILVGILGALLYQSSQL